MRDAYAKLVEAGIDNSIRTLYPGKRVYTFWKYFRNAFRPRRGPAHRSHPAQPEAGAVAGGRAAWRARCGRWEKTSDHAPVGIELKTAKTKRGRAKQWDEPDWIDPRSAQPFAVWQNGFTTEELDAIVALGERQCQEKGVIERKGQMETADRSRHPPGLDLPQSRHQLDL